jgi:hypothetical protein
MIKAQYLCPYKIAKVPGQTSQFQILTAEATHGYVKHGLALQEVVMRTWKIIFVGALLSAALTVTIAHSPKRDKTIADHIANSPQ